MKNATSSTLERLFFGAMKNSAAGSLSPTTQIPQLVGSFAWLELLTLAELAEVRPHAVAGAAGKPLRDPEGWQLRPQYGTATKLNLGGFNRGSWKVALARIDERLGPARAAASAKAQLTLPAAKAAPVAAAKTTPAPSAAPKAAAPLFGLARVEAALRAEKAVADKRQADAAPQAPGGTLADQFGRIADARGRAAFLARHGTSTVLSALKKVLPATR